MGLVELIDRGYTHLQLVQAPGANITVSDLEGAGVSVDDISALRSALADFEKDSSLGIIIGVVVCALVVVGIVAVCTCRKNVEKDSNNTGTGIGTDTCTSTSDTVPSLQRRPRKASSQPNRRRLDSSSNSRPRSNSRPASWMQDATRTAAENLLKGCRSGTFLVRPRNETSFAFSVIIRNRVIHKLIQKVPGGGFTVDKENGDWGSTLESVVGVVSLQLGTKYECAMYPLSAAAQMPQNETAKKTKQKSHQSGPRGLQLSGRPTNKPTVQVEPAYAEVDEANGVRGEEMSEAAYEGIDQNDSMNATYTNTGTVATDVGGMYETAFATNPEYESIAINQRVTGTLQATVQDPYASLLSAATTYGTRNDGGIDGFDDSESDDGSDIEI